MLAWPRQGCEDAGVSTPAGNQLDDARRVPSLGPGALVDLEPSLARDDGLGALGLERVEIRPGLAVDLDEVLEAGVGDEAPDEELPDALLAEGWRKCFSSRENKTYYFNKVQPEWAACYDTLLANLDG